MAKNRKEQFHEWLVRHLVKPKTVGGLADAMGIHQSRVSEMKVNRRQPKATELPIIVKYLGVPLPEHLRPENAQLVPLLGKGGADNKRGYYALSDGGDNFVEAPRFDSDRISAIEVAGESLGEVFDGWRVFYDEVHEPPLNKLLGQLCICWLEDDRVLVKELGKGSAPGFYNLYSNGARIEDVVVRAAARVKAMVPR